MNNTPLNQTEKTRLYLRFNRNRTRHKKISSAFTEAETNLINTALSRGVSFNTHNPDSTKRLLKFGFIEQKYYQDKEGNDLGIGIEVTRKFEQLLDIEDERY